jgi:hypothetical protein
LRGRAVHTSFHDAEIYALYEPRNYATWLAELRGFFEQPEEFLLADALFDFNAAWRFKFTPQEAFAAFDAYVTETD